MTPYEPALKPYDEATEYNPNWRDAMVGALKKGARNLTGGALFPDQEQRLLSQNARSAIPGIADPANKALAEQMMMGVGGPGNMGPALAGTIRAGGLRNLHALHTLEKGPSALIDPHTNRAYNEISSPSFAYVKEGGRIPFQTENSPIVLPRPGSTDTANHPMQLFSGDAWTRRGADLAEDLPYPKRRIEQREWGSLDPADDLRLTEGAQPQTLPHQLAVENLTRFSNLKHLEQSPKGVPALASKSVVLKWAKNMENALLDWADSVDYGTKNQMKQDLLLGPSAPWTHVLSESARKRNPFARDIMQSLRNPPKEYLEGKSVGPWSFNADKTAALLLPKQALNDTGSVRFHNRLLADEMLKRKVPVLEFEATPRPTKEFWKMVRDAEDAAGPYGGR